MNYSYSKYLKNLPLASESLPNISLPLLSSVILASFASPAYGFQVDFSNVSGNLTNGDINGIGATMTFTGVDPDNNVDLIITTLDNYDSNNPSNNGTINTNDGRINLRNGTSTTFRFSFVETGTTSPFTVSEADIGLYDIDGGSNNQEKVILYSTSDYTVAETTPLTIQTFDDRVELTSPSGDIPNPTDSSLLSQAQEEHAVNFRFNNVSEFELGYEVIGGRTTSGRNFFFAGDVVFDNTTVITTNFQVVPFEFSPSLGLLLSGGSILGFEYLKRRKQLKN